MRIISLDNCNSEDGNGIMYHSIVFAYFVLKLRFCLLPFETSKYGVARILP